MSEKEIARLEQRKFSKGRQAFALQEDGTLLVTASKGGNIQHFSVSLAGWDPEPAHEKNTPKSSLVMLRIIFILSCMPLLTIFFVPIKAIAAMLILSAIFFVLLGILRSDYLHRSYDVLVFRNPNTGGQLIFHYNVPNEKEFSEFITKLKDTIKKSPYVAYGLTPTKTAELREFARLRDDGIITNEEFEEVKRKLLSNINASSSMGFRP